MAELAARSAMAGVLAPGRSGADGEAGVVAQERPVAGAALLSAFATGPLLPGLPLARQWADISVADEVVRALSIGPRRWLLFGAAGLAARLAPLPAAIVDQSDARTIVRLSGPRVRDVLARGVSFDLHPDMFQPGHVAVGVIAHVGVTLWRLPDEDGARYDLAFAPGYAGSMVHWLSGAAAQFGLEVIA